VNYGLKIKNLRKHFKLSQQAFSDKIGMKRSNLSQIEIGRSTPTANTITIIANVFNIDANYFHFNDCGIRNRNEGEKEPLILNDSAAVYERKPDIIRIKDEQIKNFREEIEYLRTLNKDLVKLAHKSSHID
jgi:transcriptional regulator with XRE-family HTH domain